jgi:type VI protein secretion system component VasF
VKTQISPEGLPGNVLINQVRRHVPYWVIAVATVAVMFFTYMGYSYVSGKTAAASVASVLNDKDIILKLPQDNY